MLDLTTLTPEQANKIEIVLLTLESDFKDLIRANEKVSQCEGITEEARKTITSNYLWYKEAYQLIYQKEYKAE